MKNSRNFIRLQKLFQGLFLAVFLISKKKHFSNLIKMFQQEKYEKQNSIINLGTSSTNSQNIHHFALEIQKKKKERKSKKF
jgi:hypothetical protein